MTCEECGATLTIGEFPFCPHGRGSMEAVGDDIPGGQVIENLGHEPMKFYSKKAIQAEAEKRGLRLTDRWAGPGDKYLTNWSTVTAKTLEDAKTLVSCGTRVSATARCVTAQFTVTPLNATIAVTPEVA